MTSSSTEVKAGVGVVVVETPKGLVVTQCVRGSPAETGGILPGDILVKVNDQAAGYTVVGAAPLLMGPCGSTVVLGIVRNGSYISIAMARARLSDTSVSMSSFMATNGSLLDEVIPEEGEDDLQSSTRSSPSKNQNSPRGWRWNGPGNKSFSTVQDQVDKVAIDTLEASGTQLLQRITQVVTFLRESRSKLGSDHEDKIQKLTQERDDAVNKLQNMSKTIGQQAEEIHGYKAALEEKEIAMRNTQDEVRKLQAELGRYRELEQQQILREIQQRQKSPQLV